MAMSPIITSGQEMELVNSFNPGAHTGLWTIINHWKSWKLIISMTGENDDDRPGTHLQVQIHHRATGWRSMACDCWRSASPAAQAPGPLVDFCLLTQTQINTYRRRFTENEARTIKHMLYYKHSHCLKQWPRTSFCGGCGWHMALRNLELHARNDDDI